MKRVALIQSQELVSDPTAFHLFSLWGAKQNCHFPICQKLAKDSKLVLKFSRDQLSFLEIFLSVAP